jgi:hypothetical protein
MCAPLFDNAKTYRTIKVVNNMTIDQFYDPDLADLRITAGFVSPASQQAEDITLQEGDES